MARRVYIDKQHPAIHRAMLEVSTEIRKAAAAAGVERTLIELVNLRVSQINACGFCLDLHARLSVEAGESGQRLAVLPAWRETDLFTDREQAALEVAEAVALVDQGHLDEETYARARAVLNDDALSVVIWVATTIGAFNRASIMSGHPVKRRSNPVV